MITTREQGVRYTMLCTDIKHAVEKRRATNYLHQITFKDDDGTTYVAEEVEPSMTSRFQLNKKNIFEITHPGKNGTPDWIRWVGIVSEKDGVGMIIVPIPKDDIVTAQVAFQKAADLGMKHGWDEDTILDRTLYFASNIKLIARKISEEN